MLKNPFKTLTKKEYALWIISFTVVIISNLITGKYDIFTLLGTSVGVTALIFVAKGNVWGEILSVIFSILYAITSYEFRYYGEMITYLGMTMPLGIISVVSWLKHPSEENGAEVKIHILSRLERVLLWVLTAGITFIFYFILKYFDTPNLAVSTISIATSFSACYLGFFRSPYYAVCYAANDIVLIILWVLASMEDLSYFPMIICFVMFLVNDIYGFISWKLREKKQIRSIMKK